MKALVLSAVGRTEEADETIKRSLRADVLSSLCWHIYGIISRTNRNLDQALRCYRQAINHDGVCRCVTHRSWLGLEMGNQRGTADDQPIRLLLFLLSFLFPCLSLYLTITLT